MKFFPGLVNKAPEPGIPEIQFHYTSLIKKIFVSFFFCCKIAIGFYNPLFRNTINNIPFY